MPKPKKRLGSTTNPWKSGISRTPIEHLVEFVLTGSVTAPDAPAHIDQLALAVSQFSARNMRAVVLGGGTGLSTVVGGNSKMQDWLDDPFVGLKQEFRKLDVVVCTTDDGGSTGELLKYLPLIGIGDLRKVCLSSILASNLRLTYGLDDQGITNLVGQLQTIFNFRFPATSSDKNILRDPLLLLPKSEVKAFPEVLGRVLRELGSRVSQGGSGPPINPADHCLGNLILASAIFKAAGDRIDQPPCQIDIRKGLDEVCSLIGATPGRIHAAASTPGQLLLRYLNGVEVYGQHKASISKRGFPVDRVLAEFVRAPSISGAICRAIQNADLIIYAPGSLYTSILPVLQLEPVVFAIKRNRKALKVLGANAWIQEGETDISLRNEARGFLISELIEAYDRNVIGGARGLFDIVLSMNLEHIPGNILRNYALEGKIPIHLDRRRVEEMGLRPVEASIFSPEHEEREKVIQHDARRFALAIRSLLYAQAFLDKASNGTTRTLPPRQHLDRQSGSSRGYKAALRFGQNTRSPLLCNYYASIKEALSRKEFRPTRLMDTLLDLAWANRDIRPAHFDFFREARVISPSRWNRSTEWDSVLGYYDPEDSCLKIHESLMLKPERLREDLLIALGESLLGRYVESRRWIENKLAFMRHVRCYEITLRPPQDRECFLSEAQMSTYLRLARMIPDSKNPRIYRITLYKGEGFLPPGLLFGLTYAWYLNNAYGSMMDYEMALLRWPARPLMPYQAKERVRKQKLVDFFRSEVFNHRSR
jgi:uncharacterized cofD-like protein